MVNQFIGKLESRLLLINKIFVVFVSIMMAGLMILTNTDFLLRYLFRAPIVGLTEVTEIFLLYITFLGTAWVYGEDGHVVVDILLYNLYERSKKVLQAVSHCFVGLISVVLIYYGSLTTYEHYIQGIRNPSILETPIALVIVIIPLGSVLLFLEVLIKLWKTLKKGEE